MHPEDTRTFIEAREIVDRIRGHILSFSASNRCTEAVAKLLALAQLQGNLDEVMILIRKEVTYAQQYRML